MDTNPFRSGINTLRMGGQGRGGANRFINGTLDEMRIYDKALTEAQVQSDMNTPIIGTQDASPPSVPTKVAAVAVSSTQINLAWMASTDNVGVAGYNVFRGGVRVATPTITSFSDIGLTPSTSYTYMVSAFDAAGNVSPLSIAASAVTLSGDTNPPVVSITTPINGSKLSGTVPVNIAASDDTGVIKVELYENGSLLGTDTTAPYSFSWNTASYPNTTYILLAKAYDAAGNIGSTSITVYVFHHKNQ